MDKQFYRTLLILVNDKDVMAKVHSYVTARVEVLRNQLEITQNIETICAIQGALPPLLPPLKRHKMHKNLYFIGFFTF